MRTPSPTDHVLSRANPWGLTPHQCMVMRLHCKLGHVKLIWAQTDMPVKTVHSHIENIRDRMGLPGRDIRIFTRWDAWFRQYHADKHEKKSLSKAPTQTEQPLGAGGHGHTEVT